MPGTLLEKGSVLERVGPQNVGCYITKCAISVKFGMYVEYICPKNLAYGFVD